MYENSVFEELVSAGNTTGEVVSIDRFLVRIKGLSGSTIGALVLFESGQRGLIREVTSGGGVLALNLSDKVIDVGTVVVLEALEFSALVGDDLVGRVISPLGEARDGQADVKYTSKKHVFGEALGITERELLKDQLETGVSVVDILFPIVLGQRIAIMGDTKVGKTSFLTQLSGNQKVDDRLMVYVMIGKRRIEIEQTLKALRESGAMERSIVVVASIFDSLAQGYLAPYVGCAIAEHFWQQGKDVVIMYDDLSAHAKVYREISLLAQVSPGRDSYPGDMFYLHSSLLERAGKRIDNGKTLTALPVVMTPGDDITAYLPTSIMSITDGQIIFDTPTFRKNIKPAVNVGLSVSRVGGRAQTTLEQSLTDAIFKTLADYRQALEFSHFGSDLTEESRQLLVLGKQLLDAFNQLPSILFSRVEQQLVLRAIMHGRGSAQLNINQLKEQTRAIAGEVKDESDYEQVAIQLFDLSKIGVST